jgi:cytidine deaminase
MKTDPSVIRVEDALKETARLGVSMHEFMLDLLPVARARARPVISSFAVGAVAQGKTGGLYLGANVEFPGLALSECVHAEQAAVVNAWTHDEHGLSALAVTAAPCGYCRQFLNELVDAEQLHVFVKGAERTTLPALLPASFGPRDLGVTGGLMARTARHLTLQGASEPTDPIVAAGLAAASASYAPYTKTYAGVALATEDGAIVSGRYAENAAFNPSLSPLQGALARLAQTLVPYAAIKRAVLVETAGPASQRASSEAVLGAVAPEVTLEYVRAVENG